MWSLIQFMERTERAQEDSSSGEEEWQIRSEVCLRRMWRDVHDPGEAYQALQAPARQWRIRYPHQIFRWRGGLWGRPFTVRTCSNWHLFSGLEKQSGDVLGCSLHQRETPSIWNDVLRLFERKQRTSSGRIEEGDVQHEDSESLYCIHHGSFLLTWRVNPYCALSQKTSLLNGIEVKFCLKHTMTMIISPYWEEQRRTRMSFETSSSTGNQLRLWSSVCHLLRNQKNLESLQ